MRFALTLLIVLGINFSNGMENPLPTVPHVRPDQLIKVIYPFEFIQNFMNLPVELRKIILGFLIQVTAPTKRAALDIGAANFRSFAKASMRVGNAASDVNYVVTELAKRYAQGDSMEAAIALRTLQAGKLIISKSDEEFNSRSGEKLTKKTIWTFKRCITKRRIRKSKVFDELNLFFRYKAINLFYQVDVYSNAE